MVDIKDLAKTISNKLEVQVLCIRYEFGKALGIDDKDEEKALEIIAILEETREKLNKLMEENDD